MAASPSPDARLFVGIFVPPALHVPLLSAREAVPGDWRWTPAELLHLTLRFLGNVPRTAMPDLIAVLPALARHAPFPVTIAGWNGFPRRQRAHVLVRDVVLSDALDALWQETAALVEPWLARPEKKSFQAHITLGRSRHGISVPELAAAPLDWQATHVHLIESRLSPTGSSYEVRATVALGGDPWSRGGSASQS